MRISGAIDMKLLLLYLCNYEDRRDYFLSSMPSGLVSLAAYLEGRGCDVTLANFSKTGCRAALKYAVQSSPDVVGMSLYTHNRADSLKLVKEIKKALPNTVVITGGPHATHLADELLKRAPAIDYVVCGEGEKAMAFLLKKIAAGLAPARGAYEKGRIENLDTLPFPGQFRGTRVGIDPNEQFKVIITSRGCPARCAFCCSPGFWGRRTAFRGAENIVREIEYLHTEYGIIYFSIRDDNFTLRRERVLEFCRLLVEKKLYIMWNCQSRVDTVDEEMLVSMKRAGLEQIQFGVESGSEKILKMYDKNITPAEISKAMEMTRHAGIYLSIYLMAGMNGETRTDINMTRALIRQTLPGDGVVSPVALYPGTQLYNDLKRDGRIADSVWFSKKDAGIYLRNDTEVEEWMALLLNEIGKVRERAWYGESDFKQHRKVTGKDCWVTDILEGDYYMDEDRFADAESRYVRVIAAHPRNLWGYLRMGKAQFAMARYAEAAQSYGMVTRLAPRYYGGWLKRAESLLGLGMGDEARQCADEAARLNGYDPRIKNLKRLLGGNSTKRRVPLPRPSS